MAINRKGSIASKSDYAITYSDMRGVDFTGAGENDSRQRFAYLENMYKDYDRDGAGIIESVPGFRKIASLGAKIHAIYSHKNSLGTEYLIIHSKNSLIRTNSLGGNQTNIATVENRRSTAFRSGKDLYILDGKSITKILPDGTAHKVSDSAAEVARPYVPTLFINREEYEQRNLLSNRFKELFRIGNASSYSSATEGLKYKILSEVDRTCGVCGIDSSISGEVRIPSVVTIGDKDYRVVSILARAFCYNERITRVVIAEGVERIESSAFDSSSSLRTVITANSIKRIEIAAFVSCSSLTEIYLGSSLSYIGYSVFAGCSSLSQIHYSLGEEAFGAIENHSTLPSERMVYHSHIDDVSISVRPASPATGISRVTLNGKSVTFGTTMLDGLIGEIILSSGSSSDFDGCEIEIEGTLSSSHFTKSDSKKSFIEEEGTSISGQDAIKGCTLAESFDGRIFISGCEGLPNTVFYTSRDSTGRNNPLYFGVLNYFNDGTGSYPVTSLLNTGDSLAVFKSSHDADGSIYYHTPKETGLDIIPKIYPTSFVHNGISAMGDSISFLDDPVFISELGLCALNKKTINLERSIAVRSHNVNPKLLSEDLSSVRLTKWQGYLVLLAGGHIYLADSRMTFKHPTGSVEYEWFYLSGIGTYKNDERVYRYASVAAPGYLVHSDAGKKTDKTVYSESTEHGYVYYVNPPYKYQVIPTNEFTGGNFSPASAIYSPDRRLLYFGTESGDLCIFNNDKRISEGEDKGKIDSEYYSFANHAPTCALRTINDNLGIAYLTKKTVKKSLAIKIKSFGEGRITVEAGTDRRGYTEVCSINDGSIDFSELDFSNLSFKNSDSFSVLVSEKEKGWVEKAISIYSNEFASPFGVYSISYRFTVDGKIKN